MTGSEKYFLIANFCVFYVFSVSKMWGIQYLEYEYYEYEYSLHVLQITFQVLVY